MVGCCDVTEIARFCKLEFGGLKACLKKKKNLNDDNATPLKCSELTGEDWKRFITKQW